MPSIDMVAVRIPARERKLGPAHFAFMRGLVEGLPLKDMWQRYMLAEGDSGDPRVVRSTVQWIRDTFAAAARRQARPGTARLVLIDVSRLTESAPSRPSLQEFAAARGLDDFSQAEQIEAYEAEYGKTGQRPSRRARLVRKQLEALRWLESLVAQPPQLGDGVAAWLHPTIADRLEAANIFTLAQLIERINGVGRRWAASVPGIGDAKAARVLAWLREHEASLGPTIGTHVAMPRTALFRHELQRVVAPATDIRPLEKFIVPAELDGRAGTYRRPQAHCLMAATNDYQALLAWLCAKQGLTPEQREASKAKRRGRDSGVEGPLDWLQTLSHTQRAYRKEAERFLLWAVVERGKPLSSMTTEDCIAYREFLADPKPSSRWCGPRSRERWSPLWRPFEKPLDPASQRFAITVLKNLYAFWVDKNYVMGNPWSGVTVPKSAKPRLNTGRSLSFEQWRFLLAQAEQLPDSSTGQRLRFALQFLYATGLRLSEAVAARLDDLSWVAYPPDEDDPEPIEGWLLRVAGKGGRLREVPVPIEVVGQLAAYLESRGLDPDPQNLCNVGAYLLGRATDMAERAPGLYRPGPVDPLAGIAANTLYDQLKAFFRDCAQVLRTRGDGKGAQQLERASTHWLRHTHASHSIARGTRVEIAQQILGHASSATTTMYVTTEQKRRMKAMAAFYKE